MISALAKGFGTSGDSDPWRRFVAQRRPDGATVARFAFFDDPCLFIIFPAPNPAPKGSSLTI
jgi:hypothetical protein